MALPVSEQNEILYIGEDTPIPEIPIRVVSGRRANYRGDNDILYIGDD